MFQRILVILDGSRPSEQAIPVAARLASESRGTIVLVHVSLPLRAGDGGLQEPPHAFKPGAFRRREEEALRYLERVIVAYDQELRGVSTEMDLTTGAAAPDIYSAASLEKIDAILLCRHGDGDVERWVFGRIAREDIRHRPVLVLVLNEAGEMVDCTPVTPLCAYYCREWQADPRSSLEKDLCVS